MPLRTPKLTCHLGEGNYPNILKTGVVLSQCRSLWKQTLEFSTSGMFKSIPAEELPGGIPGAFIVDSIEDAVNIIDWDDDPERFFCLWIREERREDQPENGGVRWQRWGGEGKHRRIVYPSGKYIGKRALTAEFFRDEEDPDFDVIYCCEIAEFACRKSLTDLATADALAIGMEEEVLARLEGSDPDDLEGKRSRAARIRAHHQAVRAAYAAGPTAFDAFIRGDQD